MEFIRGGKHPQNQQQPSNFNITPDQLEDIGCPECGGLFFRQVVQIKKLSKLYTGAAKDQIAPMPVFRCDDCGTPLEFE